MPSAENTDLLDAMASAIESVMASAPHDVQVAGRMVAAPNPPCVDMYPGDVSRGTEAAAFGVEGEFLFTVRARVSTNDADANQDFLLNMMDDVNAWSVPMALLDDPTLGGLASSVDVIDPTGYVMYPYGTSDTLLGFQFTCRVIRAES